MAEERPLTREGQEVDVLDAQPEFCELVPKAPLVSIPVPVEIHGAVRPSLEDLKGSQRMHKRRCGETPRAENEAEPDPPSSRLHPYPCRTAPSGGRSPCCRWCTSRSASPLWPGAPCSSLQLVGRERKGAPHHPLFCFPYQSLKFCFLGRILKNKESSLGGQDGALAGIPTPGNSPSKGAQDQNIVLTSPCRVSGCEEGPGRDSLCLQ